MDGAVELQPAPDQESDVTVLVDREQLRKAIKATDAEEERRRAFYRREAELAGLPKELWDQGIDLLSEYYNAD